MSRYLVAALFVVAGIAHFVRPALYASIMPDYLPAHHALVMVSGVAEILGGLGVLHARTRRFAAWGLIALLIAVFPANLWMVQHPERFASIPVWLLYARLPLQALLIAWVWTLTRKRPSGVA